MVTFTGWRGERQRQPGFYTISHVTRGLRSGLTGVHQKVILYSYEKWRHMQYVARCLSLLNSRVVIRFFRSMRHGGKVREKVHIMQRPFLNLWVTDTLATQTKINSQRLQDSPYSFFSFSTLFSIRNPALLASHQRQKIHPTKLPTRAICFSPETRNVTKRITFS